MTATIDLAEYVGKKVVVTRKADDGSAVEVEGTCETANATGVLLKPKGKTQFELIEADAIIQVVSAPEASKKFKAKKIKAVGLGQAKSHLLERHGGTLTEVNDMTDEEAFSFHNSIDHVAADLGHTHEAADNSDSTGDESE